jgi:RHS repeat-associated protein
MPQSYRLCMRKTLASRSSRSLRGTSCAQNGGSSYIDLVVMRDKDASTAWTATADALDERRYYCQNWRADVVAIVTDAGWMSEWAKYSAYGVPFGLPGGDCDSDGDCDAADYTQCATWKNGGTYDVRGDVDLNGAVNVGDLALVNTNVGLTAGRGVLTNLANRKGYAGYEGDAKIASKWHVRSRTFASDIGRWLDRDPFEYVDLFNLYQYTLGCPLTLVDPSGSGSCYLPGPGSSGDIPYEPLDPPGVGDTSQGNPNAGPIPGMERRQQCCQAGVGKTHALAKNICCDGWYVACVYQAPEWKSGDAGASDAAKAEAIRCAKEHEKAHQSNGDLEPCSAVKNETFPGWSAHNPDVAEYNAEHVGINCLKVTNCNTSNLSPKQQCECRNYVRAIREERCRKMQEYADKAFRTPGNVFADIKKCGNLKREDCGK